MLRLGLNRYPICILSLAYSLSAYSFIYWIPRPVGARSLALKQLTVASTFSIRDSPLLEHETAS